MKQNKEQNNMKVVGITGGVGSGKSVVMNILKEKYGAEVILADLVAHDLMEPGQQNYLDIVEAFGEGILAQDKTIDRPALAKVVFGETTRPFKCDYTSECKKRDFPSDRWDKGKRRGFFHCGGGGSPFRRRLSE